MAKKHSLRCTVCARPLKQRDPDYFSAASATP